MPYNEAREAGACHEYYDDEDTGHECNPYCRGCNICEEVDEQ